jgi:histidyl-tRNA synthetase
MSLSTQPYKGARDFYPEDKRIQKYMFSTIRAVVESYGYQEYDAPIIEPLELYEAKSGQEIVNDQTYQFEDRGGRRVAIRPEMTPTVSRMVAGRRQELAYPVRWYSIPNLWRYERPQRGRLREHWQLNVDIFGIDNLSAEIEMIMIANSILKRFGASSEMFEIRVNSRKLIDKIISGYLGLDERTGLDLVKLIDRKNKLSIETYSQQLKDIVGSKSDEVSRLFESIGLDELPEELRESPAVSKITELLNKLKSLSLDNVRFDISLMRGFDYYTDIVFEVYDTNPINNRSMFGGGRYDGLVGLFGVEPVPTVGFGMGDVTLQNFIETNELMPEFGPSTEVVAIVMGEDFGPGLSVVQEIREKGVNIASDTSGRKIDKQIKSATKQNAKYVLFIGEKELNSGVFALKNLETGETEDLSPDDIVLRLGR